MFGNKFVRSIFIFLFLTLIHSGASGDDWQSGISAFKNGDLEAAEVSFNRVTSRLPDWSGGHLMLGQTLLRANRTQDALVALRSAYRLAPENADGVLALAQALLLFGDAQATEDLLASFQLDKLNPTQKLGVLSTRGKALAQLRQPALAAPVLEAAAALAGDGRLDGLLGRVWLDSDNPAAAVSLFERAVKRQPTDAALVELLARALHRHGLAAIRPAKGDICQRAAQVAADALALEASPGRWRLLGEAQTCAGEHALALETFLAAAAQQPDSWLLDFYAGREAALLEQ